MIAYRRDIDGLRAIAVAAVVLFHYFPGATPGGFTGVDVFFVISGFLITGIIAGDLDTGSFSYRRFYARRIRRIVPALVIVVSATAFAGWFILRADEYAELGRHVAASVLFVSNLLLWNEAGYFDTAAHTKPLLHLWSLAVEEQFYIVWPIVVAAAWRLGERYRGAILIRICALSFVGCVVATNYAPDTAFYWPLTRLWELALGGILATSTLGRGQRSPWAPDVWAAIGLTLIVAGFGLVTPQSPFPGWRAALPAVGAACLIAAGPTALFNRFVLSNRLVVWIGLISYPLYLWHWPLISLAQAAAAYDERLVLPTSQRRWLLVISIALACATYLLVERPIRSRMRWAPSVSLLAASLPILLLAGLVLVAANGVPSRRADDNPKARFLQHYVRLKATGIAGPYRSECDFYEWATKTRKDGIDPACVKPGPRETWFLWGDSHAQSLSSGLRAILPPGASLAQVATSGCRPYLWQIPYAAPANACDRSNAFVRGTLASLKPDLLILAQAVEHESQDWDAVARFAKAAGVRHVVLLGPLPQWSPSLPQMVVKGHLDGDPDTLMIPITPATLAADRHLAERYGSSRDLTYVSLIAKLCEKGACRAALPGIRPISLISLDYGHLSPDGSIYVGRHLLEKPLRDVLGTP